MIAVLLAAIAVRAHDGPGSKAADSADIQRHVQELTSSNPVQAAAAAYWLGRHQATGAVPQLAAVLGDNRAVDPAAYREEARALLPRRSSPGQEAAAALAHIGEPAVDALIRTLRTSNSAVARQNAAWALGQIGETKVSADRLRSTSAGI